MVSSSARARSRALSGACDFLKVLPLNAEPSGLRAFEVRFARAFEGDHAAGLGLGSPPLSTLPRGSQSLEPDLRGDLLDLLWLSRRLPSRLRARF